MKKTITLNNLIDIIKDISIKHPMIQGYGFGPYSNAVKDQPMPYLWVTPINSSLEYGNGPLTATWSIDIMVMDRIDKGDSNMQDTLSDTAFILQTIMSVLILDKRYKDLLIKIEGPSNMEVVTEATDNNVNGWLTNVRFKVPIHYNPCDELISDCGCDPCQ